MKSIFKPHLFSGGRFRALSKQLGFCNQLINVAKPNTEKMFIEFIHPNAEKKCFWSLFLSNFVIKFVMLYSKLPLNQNRFPAAVSE